jgi:FMN-dependent NADH-azoreductase
MPTLLQVQSSLFSGDGQSSRLADRFVATWRAANPHGTVVVRDLARDPVPHLDAARFGAFLATAAQRTEDQCAAVAFSDALIDELRRADVVVIGLPMYNFGVPSVLKAYFDHVARAGVTFRYTESGPQGLLKGKRVVVFAARGGRHAGTPRDTQTAFVRDFLAFIGMDDVQFVYAEGLALGEETRRTAIAEAHATIEDLAGAQAVAA